MESSPAAGMAPPPPTPRARDPLLFGSFALPAGWGCRRPMAFCRDVDAHVVSDSEPAAAPGAAAAPQDNSTRSPEKGAAAAAGEQAKEAPRWQWNLRERAGSRDYGADDARPSRKKPWEADAGGKRGRGFSLALARQEIDADFLAITGRKAPPRPRKRTKSVQRQIEALCPGSSLMEVTRDRYKVNEGGSEFRKHNAGWDGFPTEEHHAAVAHQVAKREI
ncbi:hypothetical protein ACP4OV_021568 [Aristida adscensionis]